METHLNSQVGGLSSLKNQTVRGTLTRLGRDNKKWLEKTKWKGDGILPLLFNIRRSTTNELR
jgi:hypothetical protein